MSREVIKRKLVIVGDGACGKTSLLCVFTLGEFPKYNKNLVIIRKRSNKHPTVFENYVTDCRVDGKSVQLALWDTAGQEEYERLRPLSYSKAHAILIGFAVDSPDSLDNARTKWFQEVNELCSNVPIILVGLKKDLRTNSEAIEEMRKKSMKFVDPGHAETVAKEMGARRYVECSALSGEGVDDVFEVATRASLLIGSQDSSPSCCIIV